MADDPKAPTRGAAAPAAGTGDRRARLAAAMRANLLRRKRQQRAREAPPAEPGGEADEPVERG